MRKFTIIFGLILTMTWVTATAAVDENMSVAVEESGAAMVSPLSGTPRYIGDLPQYTVTAPAAPAKVYRGAKVKTISSTSDLAGDYVLSYQNYDTTGYDGGNLVEISAVTGTDSILIDNFYGYAVKAKIDISAMTIAIPCTYLESTAYGEVYLVYFNPDSLTYSTTTEITGTIAVDGTITLNTGWGAIITSGDNAGSYYGLFDEGSTIEAVNGTMTYTTYNTTNQTSSTYTVKVVVAQECDSLVKVKNFYNKGTTIEIRLYASKMATISPQYVYLNTTYNVGWYLVGARFNDTYTTMSYYTPLTCNTATDNHTISWKDWSMIYTYNSKNYYSVSGMNGAIETDIEINYPTATELSLSGQGTASNPYLISSVADWNTLAEFMSVNNAPMDGQYIKINADLDFTETSPTPLGYDGVVSFKGDLDGNGKTITIAGKTTSTNDATLIAKTDKGANIHDLTVEGYDSITYNYSGALVGNLIESTVSNITLNLSLVSSAYYTGGITGYCYYSTIKDCAFTGIMNGDCSYTGSVVGYASYSTISGCANKGSVTLTDTYNGAVVGYGGSYTTITDCYNDSIGEVTMAGYSGAVIGYLYNYAEATNCNNYGTFMCTGVRGGGVIGYTRVGCVITGCSNYGLVSLAGTYGGGVIGYTTNVEVTECYNYGNVTSSATNAGGVVGTAYTETVMSNCGNYGSVTYTGTTASCYVAGCISRTYYGTYTNLFNKGNVSATLETASYIAGVFGNLYSNGKDYNITGCYNTADLTAYSCVAGVAAYVNTYPYIIMKDCYNTGNITSTDTTTGTSSPTAGLMTYYPKGSTFTDCWNSGTITSSGSDCTGGLFGMRKNANDSKYPISISGCYNTGNVISSGNYTGGLFGYIESNYVTIDSCYNTGNITGGSYIGGLFGAINGGTSNLISNSWNSGCVTSTDAYAGGIVGYNPSLDSFTNSHNVGEVIATGCSVGGVAGLTQSIFTNIYNAAVVTGSDMIGGLVGSPVAGNTTITIGYSVGKVVATTGTASMGNILGVSTTDTLYWGEGNSMVNTLYLTDNAVDCTDSYSTGLSYAELAKLDLGDGWTSGDNYTYPRLTTLADNDYAKAYAAAVIPADGDSYSSITTGFNVGTPDGVTWTASSGSVEIDGNNVTFSESFSGTLTMTATSGDVSVATELTCNVVVSGISDITGASREVVSETFYNLAGAQVAEPEDGARTIYIVVKSYSDGTTETLKEVR